MFKNDICIYPDLMPLANVLLSDFVTYVECHKNAFRQLTEAVEKTFGGRGTFIESSIEKE